MTTETPSRVFLCLALPFGMFVLPFILSLLLGGCATPDAGYAKCGPEGTVDWDDNPANPPPHCNRDGWNGHRYVSQRSAK